MELTERQQLFRDYLVAKPDFADDDFLPRYLNSLSTHGREFVRMAAHEIQRDAEGEIIYPKDHGFREYVEEDGWLVPTKLQLIDLLKLECDMKAHRAFGRRRFSKQAISATDIANFTYCPVAFAISRTFVIPKLHSAHVGASRHDEHRLLPRVDRLLPDGRVVAAEADLQVRAKGIDADSTSKDLFRELSDSVAVFVGRNQGDTERKPFVGVDQRYIGEPDYIFFNRRTKTYFVVEEKFHYIPRPPRRDFSDEWCQEHGYDPDAIEARRSAVRFHENHLNQLRSYIYWIPAYQLSHGYLLYWRWSQSEDELIDVEQARATRIAAKDQRNLQAVTCAYQDLKRTIDQRGGPFQPSDRVPEKCGGCVVGVLCGHKTGRFQGYSLPYSESCIHVAWVPFPDELRTPASTSSAPPSEVPEDLEEELEGKVPEEPPDWDQIPD